MPIRSTMRRTPWAMLAALLFTVSACGQSAAEETTSTTTPGCTGPGCLGSITLVQPGDEGWQLPPASFLGTNLEVFANYAAWSMVDAFKASSPWISGTPWAPGQAALWDDGRELDLDEHGWVRSLLPDQIARTTILWGPLPTRPAGDYTVLYEGEGELQYKSGATLVESSPGRDIIEVVSTSGIELDIISTNPDNYIRNIHVIMPGGIYADDPYTVIYNPDPNRTDYLSFANHYQQIIFHPDFLNSLRGYSTVRFMNWQHTNHSTQTSWQDRPQLTDARWTHNGPPLEIMIQLANQVGINPWFNIPHLADNNYATQFATMLRDQLNPQLTPYIEYSNEVWNTTFSQHTHARTQGLNLGLDTDGYQAAIKYYAQRSTEIFTIFENTYNNPNQFTAVIGSKTSSGTEGETILAAAQNAPGTPVLAISGYFGFEANWPQNCDQIANMTIDQLLDYLQETSLPIALQRTIAHAEAAEQLGIPLVVYEGGQHLTTNYCNGNTTTQHQIENLFDQANMHPRMTNIYLTHLTNQHEVGQIQLFANYHDTGKWTPTARFGARQHYYQTEAPKYQALQAVLDQEPPPEAPTTTTTQPPAPTTTTTQPPAPTTTTTVPGSPPSSTTTTTTVPGSPPSEYSCRGRPATIVGSSGDDIIIGTAGDDVIVALGGNDAIWGKEGNDVICAGSGNDYIDGDEGDDVILGQAGSDTISGSAGADTLIGGKGNDNLSGGTGRDLLRGSNGADNLAGGSDDDVISGGNGNDMLSGTSGTDRMRGGNGNDVLDGGGGNDRLSGGRNDDVLRGGPGRDLIQGNGGADTLVGQEHNDILTGGTGWDGLNGGPGRDVCQRGEINHYCERA
jgi:hypothetical protein